MIANGSTGPAPASRIDVVAPSRAEAARLLETLPSCDAQVVRAGRNEWVVRAQPWQEDSRTLNAALSAVEEWLGAIGLAETIVVVGGREFRLSAAALLPTPLVPRQLA